MAATKVIKMLCVGLMCVKILYLLSVLLKMYILFILFFLDSKWIRLWDIDTYMVSPHKFIRDIIIKFKNKKVSLFLKSVALCSSSCRDYYGYIILIPV